MEEVMYNEDRAGLLGNIHIMYNEDRACLVGKSVRV